MLSLMRYSFYIGAFLLSLYGVGLFMFYAVLPSDTDDISVESIDSIVVFTGGSKRIEKALAFVSEGFKKPVLISGVNPKVSKSGLIGHLSLDQQEKIDLDYKSLSTRDNTHITKAWLEKNHLESTLLITSFYHVPRSKLLWADKGIEAKLTVYPVFPDKMHISFLLREYHKYILAYLGLI